MTHFLRSRLSLPAVASLFILAQASSVHAIEPKVLPNNTEMVVAVNLRQIVNSDLAKKNEFLLKIAKGLVESALTSNQDTTKYQQAAGFDLFHDVTNLTVAFPAKKDSKNLFIVAQGTFDPAKIRTAMAAAEGDGLKVKASRSGSYDVFEYGSTDGTTLYVGLYDATTAFIAYDRQQVIDAFSRADGSSPSKLSATMQTLLANQSQAAFGMISTGNALLAMTDNGAVANVSVGGQSFAGLESVTVNIGVSKDINLNVAMATKDKNAAQSLKDQADLGFASLRALVQANDSANPTMKAVNNILRSIQVSLTGVRNNVVGAASLDDVQQLLNFIPTPK